MSILRKLSTYAILIGLLFVGFNSWTIFKERNVNTKPKAMALGDVAANHDDLLYATVTGGRLDMLNSIEYSLQHRKTKTTLTTRYYTPVVDAKDEHKAIYILESELQPTLNDMLKRAEYSGLLQASNNLPQAVQTKFVEAFPNESFRYLDGTYHAKTTWQRIKDMSFFVYLLLGGIVVRTVFARSAPVPSQAKSTDSEAGESPAGTA